MVRKNLPSEDITEVRLENGTITDCRGCPFKTCMHFGEQNSCFYGGPIVEEVYPAVLKCDILILLCPNYNDALSSNIRRIDQPDYPRCSAAMISAKSSSMLLLYPGIVEGYCFPTAGQRLKYQ